MAITTEQFEHIARLAYLDLDDVSHQIAACRVTMAQIETLQTVDTAHISPLHHPTSITQFLRPDNHVILPEITDLASCASAFADNLYTVPLIIKGP